MKQDGLSRLDLRGQLGRGGTARVDRAFCPVRNRELALKRALTDQTATDIDFAKLVDREYHLIGGLRFPGFVRIIEAGSEPEPYILMELCSGKSLEELGRIEPLRLALNLVSAMAADIGMLRMLNIVHGDIKPHNFFLPFDGLPNEASDHFYIRLSDFSLGRTFDEPEKSRAGAGTVGYMAPETIDVGRTSHQSDLFALGVCAYELLTGRHPYMHDETDPVKINSRIREETPPPVKELRPDVPDSVANLVGALLAIDPQDRPESALNVCEILEKSGATYSYHRILRPEFAINPQDDYESNISRILQLNDRQRRRLDLLTKSDVSCLRLVLSHNMNQSNIRLDNSKSTFSGPIQWPSQLRRHELAQWRSLTISDKKSIVRSAVGGDEEPLPILVRALLHPHTIRRLSTKLGAKADDVGQYDRAAALFLQSGDYLRAATCASAVDIKKDVINAKAFRMLLNRIIEVGEMTNNLYDMRQVLMHRAHVERLAGDANTAEQTCLRLLKLYEDHEPDELLAEVHKALGDLYKTKRDFQSGVDSLSTARSIYEQLGDELEVSHTLNNLGNMHWVKGDFDDALAFYRKALKIQKRLNADADLASTLNNLGSVFAVWGRFGRAAKIMNMALELKRKIGDIGEIARTLNNLGYLYHFTGEHRRGIDSLTESLELNRTIGDQKEIEFNLENLATAMISGGELVRSIEYLNEGTRIAESLSDKPHMGIFSMKLSIVMRRLGRYQDSVNHLEQARQLGTEIDDWFLKVSVLNEEAKLHLYLEDEQKAHDTAFDAYSEADRISEKSMKLEALLTLIRTSCDEKYTREAHELCDELHLAREHLLIDINRIERLLNDDNEGEAAKKLQPIEKAISNLSEDLELSRVCATTATTLLNAGRHEDASAYIDRAVKSADAMSLLPEQVQAHILRGKLAFEKGDYETCYGAYRKALTVAKSCAQNIGDADARKRYQNQKSIQFLAVEIRRLSELLGQKVKGR